jgi:Short C-terminal domain
MSEVVRNNGLGDRVLESFPTDNPYLQELFSHSSFGVFPNGCADELAAINNVAADEQLVTALHVGHGLMDAGSLMVTTHFLRFAKKGRLTRKTTNEFWPLGTGLQVDAELGSPTTMVLETGHQFQVGRLPIVSRKQAKGFAEVYRLVVGAGSHLRGQMEDAALESMAEPAKSPAAEIKELVTLRDAGDLSQEEFEAAKARLLAS